MTWVKICGTTNLEDALLAVEAGADAVGFVFYEKSPRCVSAETAREIVEKLPADVEKVGVFVDDSGERIRAVAAEAALTAVQIYGEPRTAAGSAGNGSPALSGELSAELPLDNFRVIVAMPSERLVPGGIITGSLPGSVVHAILLDSGTGDRPGGTGVTFDWSKNQEYLRALGETAKIKIIVAGGLTPQNVVNAIETLQPWGVDVVSGVEARKGKKDPEKVRAFVKAVREMDRKVG
jgi:phosphoribosylanthranilate isomerase